MSDLVFVCNFSHLRRFRGRGEGAPAAAPRPSVPGDRAQQHLLLRHRGCHQARHRQARD